MQNTQHTHSVLDPNFEFLRLYFNLDWPKFRAALKTVVGFTAEISGLTHCFKLTASDSDISLETDLAGLTDVPALHLRIFLDFGQTSTLCCCSTPASSNLWEVCQCLPYLQQLIQQLQGLKRAGFSAVHRRTQPLHQGKPRLRFASGIQSRPLFAARCSEFGSRWSENHLAQQRTQPWDTAHGQEKL